MACAECSHLDTQRGKVMQRSSVVTVKPSGYPHQLIVLQRRAISHSQTAMRDVVTDPTSKLCNQHECQRANLLSQNSGKIAVGSLNA